MRIADGLWLLGNHQFGLYLARGEKGCALVEVGISAVADEVVRQLRSLDARPDWLVVMHAHGDHVTGLDAMREAFPASRVVAGEGTREFLANPKAALSIAAEDAHMSRALAALGVKPGRPPVIAPPSVDGCVVAREGHEIDLGGMALRILEVKGHAPGGLAIHVPSIDALLPSDSLGFRYTADRYFPIFFTGYADYMATLDRLEPLGASVLGLPHQGPRTGGEVEDAFALARRSAADLRERVRNDPRAEDVVAAELFAEYYRDDLTLYSVENIGTCCRLLVRRGRA